MLALLTPPDRRHAASLASPSPNLLARVAVDYSDILIRVSPSARHDLGRNGLTRRHPGPGCRLCHPDGRPTATCTLASPAAPPVHLPRPSALSPLQTPRAVKVLWQDRSPVRVITPCGPRRPSAALSRPNGGRPLRGDRALLWRPGASRADHLGRSRRGREAGGRGARSCREMVGGGPGAVEGRGEKYGSKKAGGQALTRSECIS